MFKPNTLYFVDAYKVAHKKMLAPGTTKLYGTWIPRSTKYAPNGITKIVSFGQQLVWKWIHDEFEENFFFTNDRYIGKGSYAIEHNNKLKEKALQFIKDMSLMLGQDYDGKHFEELWDLGYLPIKVKSLPEGIETNPNIPHMTFINTVDGFAWLTLYLETIVSSLAWKPSTAATLALHYRRNLTEWVMKTDPNNAWLIDYLAHDFSARGLNPHDMISVGLGHATSFRGSDTLITIPAARYFYNEPNNEVVINSVTASEHSVSTTKIFTVGEKQMLSDWMKTFPNGILSVVADTFDLWKLITEYLPSLKDEIMGRDGKLVIRPDSGDPVDIICGKNSGDPGIKIGTSYEDACRGFEKYKTNTSKSEYKGVIELLWDIFGGTEVQGSDGKMYKVLDPHIGAIYGDSITPERQLQIYERLAAKGFATTNIVLGVGSYTYQYNTRDTFGFAAKGAWFEVKENNYDNCDCKMPGFGECNCQIKSYNIYKDPITDDGTKKSLKGLCSVVCAEGKYYVKEECTIEEENDTKYNELQTIYEDGKFFNQTSLKEIRERLKQI